MHLKKKMRIFFYQPQTSLPNQFGHIKKHYSEKQKVNFYIFKYQ